MAQESFNKNVKMTLNNKIILIELSNSTLSKEFASRLPLTVRLKDYASIEKISVLTKKLNANQTTRYGEDNSGDFAYYNPWGNIALFYKGVEKATDDLFILGTIKSGKNNLNIQGEFEATFELVGTDGT